jgi:hypothetical protein
MPLLTTGYWLHWARHAACSVAWTALCAVLEEARGSAVKAQQDAHAIALLVSACLIAIFLAVPVEGSIVSIYEPAIGAVPPVEQPW